ncbi:energy transducer TonB [Permianibacter sp. IMCC34836]|uniref:energy transducer TonB n=1 Tax=Permianibacter fluminis TaxID=2738515 RepID=UPI0015579DCD|nr:energy transducer TonB [Permianibacter fluminis]NQD38737.1 energy transducer TonB [Permianibacter fluminis]
MNRLLLGLFGGAVVAFALLLMMAGLVTFGESTIDQSQRVVVEFGVVKSESEIKEKERRVPRKPEAPKTPPPPSAERMQSSEKPVATMVDLKLDTSALGAGDGPALGGVVGGAVNLLTGTGGVGAGDGMAIPIATLAPRYPTEAARDGVQGYVCFKFTIQPDGSVGDLDVYDAKPRRVFDQEARRAIQKWKFRPAIVDGKPVAQPGAKYCMDFKLDEEG